MMESPILQSKGNFTTSNSPFGTPQKRRHEEWSRRATVGDAPAPSDLKVGMAVYGEVSEGNWQEAMVHHVTHNTVTIKLAATTATDHNQVHEVHPNRLVLRNPSVDYTLTSDLTKLTPLSTPAVLTCLRFRYHADSFYTRAGSTLVAVNPFCPHPHLYDQQTILRYHEGGELPPHVYSVAEGAYSQLQRRGVCQSVIVSGESGAGKTESAKHLMKYLVTVANSTSGSSAGLGCRIERRILDSNPILEAFGNAATLRNHNSSRFGKYIQLQFDRCDQICGASIQTYLLEKTRVVQQAAGEWDFHVFYQLLHGESGVEKWLKVGGQDVGLSVFPDLHSRQTEMDINNWQALLQALANIGLEKEEQHQVFLVLCAVLHLCNMEICLEDEDDDDIAFINTDQPATQVSAEAAAQLLGVGQPALEATFTHRKIVASHSRRKSVFHKPCTVKEGRNRKDCLAKILYARLFEWLVAKINQSICSSQPHSTIGILDIYGFESFETNNLEQLCINYANEKLQQHFVVHFLKDLQEDYAQEAITWEFTDFADNRPCLDVLEGSMGLFAILNEECAMNRPSNNESLSERITSSLSSSQHLTHSVRRYDGFLVKHYAQPVAYVVDGLLEKNKDNTPVEVMELLVASTSTFICGLFEDMQNDPPGGRKKKTVLSKFKSSLDQLMVMLESTEPHYIRCLKPNPRSEAKQFDGGYMLAQLQACGVVETVNISKQGYPARMKYDEFLSQYSLILRNRNHDNLPIDLSDDKENELLFEPLDILHHRQLNLTPKRKSTTHTMKLRRPAVVFSDSANSGDHSRNVCASIMRLVFGHQYSEAANICAQFGKTKLFLKDGQLEKLECERSMVLSKYATRIQATWRGYKARQAVRQRRAAIAIQAVVRGWEQRRATSKKLKAIKTLQRFFRRRLAVKEAQIKVLKLEKEIMADLEHSTEQSPCGSLPIDMMQHGEIMKKYLTPTKTTNHSYLISQRTNQSHSHMQSTNHSSPHILPDVLPYNLPDVANHIHVHIIQEKRVEKESISTHLSGKIMAHKASTQPVDYKKVTESIISAFASGKRFQLIGGFTGLPYLEAQNGILSRRRMPRVTIRFHTKANQVLKYGHHIHRKEFICSITDCLPCK